MQPKALSAEAVQSQSSHLPVDRLELEAVFAQLIPSPSQDKHTTLYTYMRTVCHSPPQGHEQGRVSKKCVLYKHMQTILTFITNVSGWVTASLIVYTHMPVVFQPVYVWHLYRFGLTDWLVTYSLMRRVAGPTILLVSWNWPHLDPKR